MAHRIKELREQKGLLQKDLAARLHVTPGAVQKKEANQRDINIEWLKRFAKALDCFPADLLADEDNPYRLDDTEREIIDHFRATDPTVRQQILKVVRALSSPFQTEKSAA